MLRGIAVLAVLLYHSKLVPVAGGYLGVDIFFVISGYLITKNILTDISRQRFSFLDFYSRRARRLLPAAYCTLIVTTLLASRVLTEDRWSDYLDQLLGAVTFTANFVLPLQSGYFETAAETKPLLHIWSLSVEEQYYFLAPLLLVLLRPRWRFGALLALALLSLALCMALVSTRFTYWRLPALDSQQMAFFMLPARAWEMLAGSLLACIAVAQAPFNPPRAVKFVAVGLLCVVCAYPMDSLHPRADALVAVLLTALLIAGDGKWVGNSAPVRAIARVGDWSYSLYLVHWPLFALATSAYLGQVPTIVRGGLVVLSLGLAYLQYEFVEQRFRHGRRLAPRQLLRLAAASATVAALPFAIGSVRLDVEPGKYDYLHQRNSGLSSRCAAGAAIDDPAACSTAANPRVALWGDSYAMHLVPGLLKVPEVGASMIQITKAACAPVPGVASLDANYDAQWARGCLAFTERARDLIARSPTLRHVILSSPYSGYLDHGDLALFVDGRSVVADRSAALERLITLVSELQAHGKQVILVAPPPKPGFDVGACREQQGLGLVMLGRTECDFSYTEHEANQAGIVDGLKQVSARTGAAVVWFDSLLCSSGVCRTGTAEGVSIYKDGGHLSIPGSMWAVPKLGLEHQLID
ncbi:MAG: acyltransferase family protein [Rubrivivax sp.]|nr:acyltransferase family protein [Rubrivivax sp.]